MKDIRNPEAVINDNLFEEMNVKQLVIAHIIFWSKRWLIVLLICISPYFKNQYTIIVGFLLSLIYLHFELDYRATTNKLEYIYVLIYSVPSIIVSFMAMLMEGHYISYTSKYVASEMMMVLIMLVFITMVPFRFYDFYKYQKIQKLKREARYRNEKINSTTNQTNLSLLKDKDLSGSQCDDEPIRTRKGYKNSVQKSVENHGFSDIMNGSKDHGIMPKDDDIKGWKRKDDAPSINGHKTGLSFLSSGTAHKSSALDLITKKQSLETPDKSLKEESKSNSGSEEEEKRLDSDDFRSEQVCYFPSIYLVYNLFYLKLPNKLFSQPHPS